MDEAVESLVAFLAGMGEEKTPLIAAEIDKYVVNYLISSNVHGWEISAERQRLADAFLKIAQDSALKSLILERIYNAPFKAS